MTSSERNSNLMGISVANTMSTYQSTWLGSPSTAEANEIHLVNLEQIVEWQIKQDQALSIPGLIENRDQVRSKITIMLIHFIGSISAWAYQNGKNEIVAQINFSEAKLKSCNLSAFKANATLVYNAAFQNAVALVSYGIVADEITDLYAKINSFSNLIGTVKATKANVKTATKMLNLSVSSMLTHLKFSLDRNVKQFIDTPFFSAYFNSRKTYNLNSASTTLRGSVKMQNGNHIHNATVSIINPESARTVVTNKSGNFKIRNLDLDNCTLRVTADGCLPAEFDVSLQRSRTNIFNITMAGNPVSQQQPIVHPH